MLTALADDEKDTMVFSTVECKKYNNTDIILPFKCCGFKNDGSKCSDKVFLKIAKDPRYNIPAFFCHAKGSSCSETKKHITKMNNEFLIKWAMLLTEEEEKCKYWKTNGRHCISNDTYNIYLLNKIPSLDYLLEKTSKKKNILILNFSLFKNNSIIKKGNEYFIKQSTKYNLSSIIPEVLKNTNVEIFIDKLDNFLYNVCLNNIYYDNKNTSYLKISIVSISREITTRFYKFFNIKNYNFDKIIEDTTEYFNNDLLNDITPEDIEVFDNDVKIIDDIKNTFISINKKYDKLIKTDYNNDELDNIITDYDKVIIPSFKKNIYINTFLKKYIHDKKVIISFKKTELYFRTVNDENINIMNELENIILKTVNTPPIFFSFIKLIIDITLQIRKIIDNNIILLEGGFIQCLRISEQFKNNDKKLKKNKYFKTYLFNYLDRVDKVIGKIDKLSYTFYKNDLKTLHHTKNIQNTYELNTSLEVIKNYDIYYCSKKTKKNITLIKDISSYFNPNHPNLKININEVKHIYTNQQLISTDISFESEYKNKNFLMELGCEWDEDTYLFSYNTSFSKDTIIKIKLLSYKRVYFENLYKYKDELKELGCYYDFKKRLSYYPSTLNKITIKRIKRYETSYI